MNRVSSIPARVLAAFRPHSEAKTMLERHKPALGEPEINSADFLARLKIVRKQGFEIMPSATTVGVTNLAFPVFDPHGRAITVVSCPYLERIDDLSVPNFEKVTQLYRNLANELTEQYGGTVPVSAASE